MAKVKYYAKEKTMVSTNRPKVLAFASDIVSAIYFAVAKLTIISFHQAEITNYFFHKAYEVTFQPLQAICQMHIGPPQKTKILFEIDVSCQERVVCGRSAARNYSALGRST